MVKWYEKRWVEDILKFVSGVLFLILINQLGDNFFFRMDLTQENRFTIKPATRQILEELDDKVYIDVYLEGDLNNAFKRFQKSIRETLEEFSIYSNGKVQFDFIDPGQAASQNARNEFMANLASRGIQPTNIIDTRDGQRTERILFPGAIVTYGSAEKGVMLLQGLQGEDQLNASIENIEYNLIKAIFQLTSVERKKVVFIKGHGEADSAQVFSIKNSLSQFYNVEDVDMTRTPEIPSSADLAVIVKPTRKWSETDKYKLDQFIMNGGRALFLIDRMDANMDSANREFNVSFAYETGLDDMLFRYGARVNPDLIQDNNAALYPIVTGMVGDKPQFTSIPWPFYPVLNRYGSHPISRNLDAVLGRFVNSIDTVKATGINKTPLIMTSAYSRTVESPAQVSVADLRKNLRPESLNRQFIPVAWLLEGSFSSIYKNRFLPAGVNAQRFRESGIESKIIVVADGDLAINDLDMQTGEPLPLGRYNFQPSLTFANENFLLNAISYLVDQDGIITARNKEIKIRPLDKVKVARERLFWQTLNLGLPIILTIGLGLAYNLVRKRKYTKFGKE